MAGRVEESIRAGREALSMADDLGIDELRAHALNSIGIGRLSFGDLGGIDDLEAALAIAVENNLPEAARAYGNLAEVVSNLGDLRRGFELRAEGRRMAERFGLAHMVRFLRAELVVEHYWRGQWDEALALAGELLEDIPARSAAYMDASCWFIRARIALARADPVAGEAVAEALRRARLIRDPQVLYPTLALSARAELAAGRAEAAAALVDEVLTAWAERPETMLDSHLQSFPDVAIALLALSRERELVELAGKAAMQTKWIDAATAYVGGDFQRAAEIYAEAGSLPDEAFARLRAAEALIADGRRAEGDQELQRAVAFYRSVDATAYIREGEALLARTA